MEFISLKNNISEKREQERRQCEEEERRGEEKEWDEIKNLIYQTEKIIKESMLDATNTKDSLWLGALKILWVDFQDFSQKFETRRISYKDAKFRILYLKEQVEVLSTPPEKKPKQNYYDILGIKRDASSEQIKSIYRRLSQIYHPDTGSHLGVDGEQPFRKIKEAYETLIDPDKRKEYDKKGGL